jgi:hypothetical protein
MEPNESPSPEVANGPEGSPPADPPDLVDQMVQAGEWPKPELVEQIAAAGEAAVEPLREVARSRPRGWPSEAPLVHAVGLLGELKPPSALPELAAVAREYLNETSQEAGDALARYGAEGFEALLGLIQDPAVAGYQRTFLVESAKQAAGDDPVRRARLAEVLRDLFVRTVEQAREANAFAEELTREEEHAGEDDESVPDDDVELEIDDELGEEPIEDEDWTDGADEQAQDRATSDEASEPDEVWDREKEQAENELPPDETLAFLASDLCDLADPLAREMMLSAFADGLIDESIIDEGSVDRSYQEGPRINSALGSYPEGYRQSYLEHQERQARLATMRPPEFPTRTSYPSLEPGPPPRPVPPAPPVEPIRNTGPRIGRNDPCWCGSGKKYKKCHLGKDAPE